jgi:hypothetical protein
MEIHDKKCFRSPMKNGEQHREEKKVEKLRRRKNELKRRSGGTYMPVLPTDSSTDTKLIIILIYSVGEVLKIRQ